MQREIEQYPLLIAHFQLPIRSQVKYAVNKGTIRRKIGGGQATLPRLMHTFLTPVNNRFINLKINMAIVAVVDE